MAWTVPRTWVVNERVETGHLNPQLRDNFLSFGGPWTPYGPFWFSSAGTPAIGNGTLNFRYAHTGKWTVMAMDFIAGSTTTFGSAGGVWNWQLPFNARTLGSAGQASFGGWFYGEDAATAAYSFWPRFDGISKFHLVYDNAAVNGGLAAQVGITTPFTWATGDYIRGYVWWEGV